MTINQSSIEKCAHWLVNTRNTKVIPKIFCSYFFDTFCIFLEFLILVIMHSILNNQNRLECFLSFFIFLFRSLNTGWFLIGDSQVKLHISLISWALRPALWYIRTLDIYNLVSFSKWASTHNFRIRFNFSSISEIY